MKVFVGGSRPHGALEDEFRQELMNLVANNDDALLSDSLGAAEVAQEYFKSCAYDHVTVYTGADVPKRSADGWDVRRIGSEEVNRRRLVTPRVYGLFTVAGQVMALEADAGLVAWNGMSKGVLLDVLMLFVLGKPVRVISPTGVHDLTSLDDFGGILLARNAEHRGAMKGVLREEQARVVKGLAPSKEVASYLTQHHLTKRKLIELILGSPVSLQRKYEACERCSRFDDVFYETAETVDEVQSSEMSPENKLSCTWRCWRWTIESSFTTHRDAIGKALKELHVGPGEFLYRKSVWDEQPELYEEHEQGIAPFDSLDAALNDLRREMAEEEWDEDAPYWTVLEKWRYSEKFHMWCNPYTYYLVRDEIVFFDKNYWDGDERRWRPIRHMYTWLKGYGGGANLTLPTPFRAGDIVTLDCRPFAPLAHAIVLLPYDYKDSDRPYGLVKAYGEKAPNREPWRTLSLPSGGGLCMSMPGYSPLYRMEVCDAGELLEPEQVLADVQRWIAGDAARAKRLDNAMLDCGDGMTDDDLRAFMESEG